MPETGRTHRSEWLTGEIFDQRPQTWRDLQDYVAQVFRETGCVNVETPYKLAGVRTTKEVDVYAEDTSVVPPIRIACECKHWTSAVPQGVVLEFRSVLEDSGVNRGFIISRAGFQSPGAHDASRNTCIVLLDFEQFMALFFDSWLKVMSVRLDKATHRLFPFFDIYYFENLPELPKDKLQLFFDLQHKYRVLFSPATRIPDGRGAPISMAITARNTAIIEPLKELGITSFRQFFDVLLTMADQALIDFCSLFRVAPESL